MPTTAGEWAARGFPCRTASCRGHIKGWEFAETYNITDPEYANGNSQSFNEGVQAYALDQITPAETAADEVTGGGMVAVSGYFRKSGVFVSPYTRRRVGG